MSRTRPTEIGLPGPTPRDMLRSMRFISREPLAFLGRMAAEHGDTVAFPIPGPPVLLVNDPADVQRVLRTGGRSWSKQTVQYAAFARVTGPGLLAADGPTWLAHRRVAAPAFHHERIEAVGGLVREAADDAIGARLRTPGFTSGDVVDLAELCHHVGLDVVGRTLFSVDLTGQAADLLRTTGSAAELVVRQGRSLVSTLAWAPTPTNLRLLAARRRLARATAGLVAQRRDTVGPGAASYGDDLLGLLLDSDLTDEQVGDELVTMVIAGHETVASALSWTLMLLAEHPAAQDRLRAEVAAAGEVSFLRHREALPFTRAVVDEALRLFPPAWVVSRRAREADRIAGRDVPAGTLAIISPWLVQRRAEDWPDPEAFDPGRFADGATQRPAYLPFGAGPRLCIGRELALAEMVVVLGRLLGEFRVSLPPGYVRPAPETLAAVQPEGGMPLVVTRPAGR